MLSKLIKYELKDASHSLFPIGLGMAILSVISALMVGSATKGFDLSRLPFYPLLSGLVGLLTFICVIAVVVICLMSNVGSFYRMLGHRGYLEMSLPVTIHQHIAAKLISAVLTTLLTLVFLNLCGFVIVLPNQPANWFSTMLGEGLNMLQNTPISFVLLLVLFLLAGVAMFYLYTYLCCAIGGFFPQQRKLASIITFFILQFVAQVLFLLVVSFAFSHMESLVDTLSRFATDILNSTDGEWKFFYGSLTGAVVIEVLIDAVLWFVTRTILVKSLNLP